RDVPGGRCGASPAVSVRVEPALELVPLALLTVAFALLEHAAPLGSRAPVNDDLRAQAQPAQQGRLVRAHSRAPPTAPRIARSCRSSAATRIASTASRRSMSAVASTGAGSSVGRRYLRNSSLTNSRSLLILDPRQVVRPAPRRTRPARPGARPASAARTPPGRARRPPTPQAVRRAPRASLAGPKRPGPAFAGSRR